MKSLFIILTLIVSTITVDAQELKDENTLILNDSTTLTVEDQLIVNLPYSYDFVSVEEVKKGFNMKSLAKIGNIGSAVGGTLGSIGAATGKIGVLSTGVEIMNKANVATSIGMTAEAIEELQVSKKAKQIISKKMQITEFKKEGNSEVGYAYYAIANILGDKKKYKIDIEPAIRTNEILVIKE